MRRPRSRKPYIMGGVILLVLVLLGLFLLLNSNNQATITETGQNHETRLASYQDYDGTYIRFRYDSRYAVHNQPSTTDDLELAYLRADTNYDKTLSVAVSKLPNGDLGNNSAYNLRKANSADYSLKQLNVDGNQALIYIKKDGLEQTVFLPKGNKVAVLSFATTGTVDDLQSEVVALLYTFHWKQS